MVFFYCIRSLLYYCFFAASALPFSRRNKLFQFMAARHKSQGESLCGGGGVGGRRGCLFYSSSGPRQGCQVLRKPKLARGGMGGGEGDAWFLWTQAGLPGLGRDSDKDQNPKVWEDMGCSPTFVNDFFFHHQRPQTRPLVLPTTVHMATLGRGTGGIRRKRGNRIY